jgi:hypothetical protein
VQVDYNVVHLRTSLVQLFALLLQNFKKVVQMIELKRFGGASNGYPFAPLARMKHYIIQEAFAPLPENLVGSPRDSRKAAAQPFHLLDSISLVRALPSSSDYS